MFSTKTDHTLPCSLQQGFRCRAGRRPIPLPPTPSPVHLSCSAHTPPIFQKGVPPGEDVEPPEAGMLRPLSPSTLLHTTPADVHHQVEESVTGYHAYRRAEGTNLRDLLQQQPGIVGLNAARSGEEENSSMTHLILWFP